MKALAPYHFTPHPEPIKLDQNESPDDVPELIKVRVMQQLAGVAWNRYPELSPAKLEGKLAAKHEWPTAGVVVANGSNTLIQALTIVAGLGRKVITVAPTFAVYAAQARLLEARLIEVPLGADFALPSSALLSAMAGGPGVLFLANPAAPTGNLFSAAQVEELIAAGADQTLVVIDEAYAEFAGADLVKLVARYPNAVILRTFSKAFGLAGARVGYALAHAEVAQEVRKALLPFSVNPWQVAVASVLLDEEDLVSARVQHVKDERARIVAALAEMPGVRPFPSEANFVLFRTSDPAGVYERLLAAGIVIRRQDHLPGAAGCLRVSVGTSSENDAFITACRSAVEPQSLVNGGAR